MIVEKWKYSQDSGVKESKINGWMQRHWTKGKHYYVIGRTTMINISEVNAWLQNSHLASIATAKDCRLESSQKEKRSIRKLSIATQRMPLK